jgi:broad specificity phosphatase PhoE
LGSQQAQAVANELAANNDDGTYASSMIRTQATAAPLADLLELPIVVLPGLREIDAGVFEGQSEDEGLGRIGYVLAPVAWTLGARFVPVLGSTDGNAFDARVDDAVQTIYDSGDPNAVAFSHGATTMFWVMMNVDNPDLGLLLSHPLGKTGVVVVTGNPEDGWTLVDWDGVQVAAEPSLPTKLFVDVRNVVTAH